MLIQSDLQAIPINTRILRIGYAGYGFGGSSQFTSPPLRWPMGPLRASAVYLPHLILKPFVGRMKPRRGPCPQIRQPLYCLQVDIPYIL